MSNEGVPESQPNSQNYSNNLSENNNSGFRLELSPQQAVFLSRLLPSPLSFQLELKPIKRTTSIQKNIRENPKAIPEPKRKNPKVDLISLRTTLSPLLLKQHQPEFKNPTPTAFQKILKMQSTKSTVPSVITRGTTLTTSVKTSSPVSAF